MSQKAKNSKTDGSSSPRGGLSRESYISFLSLVVAIIACVLTYQGYLISKDGVKVAKLSLEQSARSINESVARAAYVEAVLSAGAIVDSHVSRICDITSGDGSQKYPQQIQSFSIKDARRALLALQLSDKSENQMLSVLFLSAIGVSREGSPAVPIPQQFADAKQFKLLAIKELSGVDASKRHEKSLFISAVSTADDDKENVGFCPESFQIEH